MLRYSFLASDTLVTIIASMLDFLSLIFPEFECPRDNVFTLSPLLDYTQCHRVPSSIPHRFRHVMTSSQLRRT